MISGHKKTYLSGALLRAYQPKPSAWHGNAFCRLGAIAMSFFFPLSIALDPDTASHMLFFLEGGNSENAKYLIYLWLRKRSLREPNASLLFVTGPAKILTLSETFPGRWRCYCSSSTPGGAEAPYPQVCLRAAAACSRGRTGDGDEADKRGCNRLGSRCKIPSAKIRQRGSLPFPTPSVVFAF